MEVFPVTITTDDMIMQQGELRYKSGKCFCYLGEKLLWQAEGAKMHSWQQHSSWTAEATVHESIKQHTHCTRMEKQGFSMPAWLLTQQIQDQVGVDTMVGPTIFESYPSYQHTFHREEVERIN